MKKVCVLMGSPRKNGNTEGDKARAMTDILDEAFAQITVDEAIEGFEKCDIACSRFFTGLSTVTDEQIAAMADRGAVKVAK